MNRKYALGLTIVELMVSLAISAVLLLGVGTVYVGSRQSYKVQDQFAMIQENARYAHHLVTKEVRQAGFQGCARLEYLQPNVISDPSSLPGALEFDKNNFIKGHGDSNGDGTQVPALPSTPTHTPLAGTDAVTVRKASSCGATLTGVMTVANANVQLMNSCGFEQGDVVMITDCESADIFTITNTPGGQGSSTTLAHANGSNIGNRLSKNYLDDAQVMKFEQVTYFIANNDDGIPSLYQSAWVNNGGAVTSEETELVDNVEDFHVLFGVDNSGENYSADRYMTAEEVESAGADTWGLVTSVKLALLMRSDQEVGKAEKKFTFDGNTVTTPGDKRYRREFTTTVNIRNRTP
ncbi:MAG: PilW family protein [Pseudomonadota bacterium]|nr:MAG: PilW family protein [Pseudomonadota bacterium]